MLADIAGWIVILLLIFFVGKRLSKSLGTRWDRNQPSDEKLKKFNKDHTWKFECPKCFGTEVYFANRPISTGIFGIRAKQVKTPYCRSCDVVSNMILLDPDGKPSFLQPQRAESISDLIMFPFQAIAIIFVLYILYQLFSQYF